MGAGWAGCPGDCVWGGITGEAAGGTAGGAGDGRPVGCWGYQLLRCARGGSSIRHGSWRETENGPPR